MEMLRAVLFIHVAAAIGLFVALAIEWVALARLRRSVAYEQAREWAGLWSLLAPVGVSSFLLAGASGAYLAKTLGAWPLEWAGVAVPALVVVAIAAGVTRRRRMRLLPAISAGSGPLPPQLLADLRQPLLLRSLRLRAALLAGLVWVMTVKPDHGMLILLAVASLGALWALAVSRGPDANRSVISAGARMDLDRPAGERADGLT